MDPASDGEYVIGEEVAKRKMISQSSGGSLGLLLTVLVVVVVVGMVFIDIMVFFEAWNFALYNDERHETNNYSETSDREVEWLIVGCVPPIRTKKIIKCVRAGALEAEAREWRISAEPSYCILGLL